MAPKGAECLAAGFQSSPTPITKLQCWCPLEPRLSSQKEDCECPQGWLRSRGVLEGLSQPAMVHELRCRFSLRHALVFVAVGIVTFVFL